MSKIVNTVVEIGSFGLIDDVTGVEGAEKAAREASGLQSNAALAGVDEQRRQFDITQQNLQPFSQAGADALNQQRILLGLGGSEVVDPNAQQRVDLQSQIDALNTTNRFGAAGTAAQAQGFRGALERMQFQSDEPRAQEQLAQQRGLQSQLDALGEVPQGSQLSNSEQQQQAFDQFNESPGQKFLRDRAQKNLVRNASAIGGLGGGNVRSALVQQGVGFAQQDFENQFGRLGQIAGQGQAATTNIGQFGQQAAQGIAGGLQNSASARASGILGAAQQGAQFNQGLLGLGGTVVGGLAGGGFFNS